MNKCCYMFLLSGMVGCATTSQIEESNNRILDLEKKLARIEGDLYRVEVKSAPKQQVVEPKFVPAKEVKQNVIDTKIDAFLKEYLDVAFGDSIEKYQNPPKGHDGYQSVPIQVRRKFQYFDKAGANFYDGKLYQVVFFADIDKKYSIDSTNQRINQTLADMAVTFGVASDSFEGKNSGSSYSLRKWNRFCSTGHEPVAGCRRCGAVILNRALLRKLQEEKEARKLAEGAQLPVWHN